MIQLTMPTGKRLFVNPCRIDSFYECENGETGLLIDGGTLFVTENLDSVLTSIRKGLELLEG